MAKRGRKKMYSLTCEVTENQLSELMRKSSVTVTTDGKKVRLYYYGQRVVRNGQPQHLTPQATPLQLAQKAWWRFW